MLSRLSPPVLQSPDLLPPALTLNATEWGAALGLASLFMVRMMGIFMILPVFSLYAEQLRHASPQLIVLAIGCYCSFPRSWWECRRDALHQVYSAAVSDGNDRTQIVLTTL